MRSGNPTLRETTFSDQGGFVQSRPMTLEGTVNKTLILLLLVFASAFFTWYRYFSGGNVSGYVFIGIMGGLIFSIITTFRKHVSPITAPIYAVFEGLSIGGISAMYEREFQGITFLATILTFSVLFGLLLIYKFRLIKVTENFRMGMFSATIAILFTYLVNFLLQIFGVHIPFLHDSGPIGIFFSLLIVSIASFNLVLDFDFIEQGVKIGAPKYMEWYGAFGLMVTLIWLYLEILRLLAKVKTRKS